MSSAHQFTLLELLPNEILYMVVQLLCMYDVGHLAFTSKRLREVCMPYLFYNVRFSFSASGFSELRRLLLSDVRQNVVSFTYVIPELLRPEISDFEFFKRNVLLPEDYADISRGSNRESAPVEMCVPYVLVYNTFSGICKEQQRLVERHEDATALSAVFRWLPRLTELCLLFRQTLATEPWMPLFMDHTVERYTYGHHFHVISNALKAGRGYGAVFHTVHLSGLELPYHSSLRSSQARELSPYLEGLLRYVQNLRLSGSGSVLKSLSHTTLRLQQLDLCGLTIAQTTLVQFLRQNASPISSIGFHNVKMVCPDSNDLAAISPELCRSRLPLNMLFLNWKISPCPVCGHSGWRMSKT